MNKDEKNSASQNLTQETLQNNLINALNRLQHTAFEKEFLSGDVVTDADAKPESFFGFGVGIYNFMVMASCFCEVFVETTIASVPNAPESLVGLSNIRGVLIPVYQIHTELKVQLPKKSIIFVLGKGDAAVGLLIDSLPVSLSLSAYQYEIVTKQENPLLQKIVQKNYFSNSTHWLLINGHELGHKLLVMASSISKSTAQSPNSRAATYM